MRNVSRLNSKISSPISSSIPDIVIFYFLLKQDFEIEYSKTVYLSSHFKPEQLQTSNIHYATTSSICNSAKKTSDILGKPSIKKWKKWREKKISSFFKALFRKAFKKKTFEKKNICSPLEVKNTQKTWYPPKKIHKKSVSKLLRMA